MATLPATDLQLREDLAYYLQGGGAGPRELFAQAFVTLFAANPDPHCDLVRQHFPGSIAAARDALNP